MHRTAMMNLKKHGMLPSVTLRHGAAAQWRSGDFHYRSKKTSSKQKLEAESNKGSALRMAIQQLEANYGKNTVMQLGSAEINTSIKSISTGSLGLDVALGIGGLPRGRVVEIYGPESSGKTSIALHTIAQAQKNGGLCAFIDAEHAIDPSYAKTLGVNIDDLYVSQPDSGEQALEITDTLVRSGAMDLIVVDSVAALVPRAELEGEMGDSHIALQARLMSQALRKLTASLNRSDCLLIFINQIRQKVGVLFGSPEVTSGGTALRFYSSVRLDIRRKAQLKDGDKVIGSEVVVKVAKNKLAPPFRLAHFDMMFGTGIDRNSELLELGIKAGAVARSGAWYAYINEEPLDEGHVPHAVTEDDQEMPEKEPEMESLGQGKSKAKDFLETHPEIAADIEARIRKFFLPNVAPASMSTTAEENDKK